MVTSIRMPDGTVQRIPNWIDYREMSWVLRVPEPKSIFQKDDLLWSDSQQKVEIFQRVVDGIVVERISFNPSLDSAWEIFRAEAWIKLTRRPREGAEVEELQRTPVWRAAERFSRPELFAEHTTCGLEVSAVPWRKCVGLVVGVGIHGLRRQQ